MQQFEGNYVAFLKKIINDKEDGRIDYTTMGDCLVGQENNRWSSENWRKGFYILKEIVKNIDEDMTYTQEDVIKEMEALKIEIYKERVKLRDQRRELNKLLMKEARFENLREIMESKLEDIGALQYTKPLPVVSNNNYGACLIISDVHHGIKVDNQFNYYDAEVSEERINTLVAKTIDKCKLHGINKLNVEILGDVVSGTIHTSTRVQQEEDIIEQVIDIGNILAKAINDLANAVPEVTVYTVQGNHGRISANKEDSINSENYERLVYCMMKKMVKGAKFIDANGADFICYNDFGKTFVIAHGDKDRKDSALPNYAKLLGKEIDQVHLGHWHSFEESVDKGYIINGSVMGSDDYAIQLRKLSRPMQTLLIYGEDDITYKLYLDK